MGASSQEADLHRLMQGSLSGDSGSHRELLKLLSGYLRAYFRRKLTQAGRSAADAEDLVQETIIAIHIHRNAYDLSRPLGPWVYSIARYKLIDFLRRTKTIARDIPIDDVKGLATRDDQMDVESSFDLETLLERLPTKMRRAIQFVKLKGLSVRETAERCGMSESAIKVSVHRGLRQLSLLVKQGTES
jgi:RNA polymerase sigma-70 factor (ECF subfamily)